MCMLKLLEQQAIFKEGRFLTRLCNGGLSGHGGVARGACFPAEAEAGNILQPHPWSDAMASETRVIAAGLHPRHQHRGAIKEVVDDLIEQQSICKASVRTSCILLSDMPDK